MVAMSVSSSVVIPTDSLAEDVSVSSSVVDAILANLSAASSEAVYGIDAEGSDLESTLEHALYMVASEEAVYSVASSTATTGKSFVKSLDSPKAVSVEQRQSSSEARDTAHSEERDTDSKASRHRVRTRRREARIRANVKDSLV